MLVQDEALRAKIEQIAREEMGEFLDGVEFRPPYEDEDLVIIVQLKKYPEDFEQRNRKLLRRVRSLGYDIGVLVDYPEE
ncbi:hypothetical protein GG496_000604 [Candidatus Fervidibacteria bacterium JGI MDM2 JNZ-1-D12]